MRRLAFIALISVISIKANAQLGTAAPTGTFAVKIIEALDLSVVSGASNSFNFNTIAKIDAGIEAENAVKLAYKSNNPWFVTVNANSENFSGSSSTPMPASVIQFKLNGSGSYVPLSTTPASLTGTSAFKNARGTATIGVDYRVTPGYTYEPANDYGITITYTIGNQ